MDIAEAVGVDMAALRVNIQRAAPQARILELSARSGAGMDAWYAFLHALTKA
jgi:hydrogenase nickel incorporation protein HypB